MVSKMILRKQRKESKGITLIALVITIIVLLILAAVSIATLTGENGILNKANTAKIENEKANAKEQVQIAVLGSYDTNSRLDIEKLKEELRKIQGTVTITDTNGEFPIMVTIDGYSFIINENGNIEALGPRPTIDQSSVKITLKDGGEIPTEGVDEGTELKITFIASIEDGTITNVTPGSVQNGQITYTTTGTEKEVIFKITGKVENNSYETTYNVVLKEYYKKIGDEAEKVECPICNGTGKCKHPNISVDDGITWGEPISVECAPSVYDSFEVSYRLECSDCWTSYHISEFVSRGGRWLCLLYGWLELELYLHWEGRLRGRF